jgi:hypothetical protein
MNDKEIKDFLEMLKKESKRKVTKEDAQDFLKKAGILTKNGNPAKPYKELWAYLKQA